MIGIVDDPAVLDEPLMRDPHGRLVPVDWDTALGDLAGKLSLIRDSSEPYAIGLYTGTSQDTTARYAASRLMSALGSPSTYTSTTVDSIAKILVPKLMAGRERLVPAVDFETTTLLLVIGENMVVSHGGFSYFPNPVWYLRKVTRRGEVWVIDPRRTETARLATHHLSTRSGTDFAVVAYLIRELLQDGADHDYLRRHARRVEELRHAVEPCDLAATVRCTGLDRADLEGLLRAVRRHRRLAVVTGTGVTMAATGNVTEWLVYALQIVTGSFERPGGHWFNHGATFWPSRATAPDTSQFGPGSKSHPEIGRIAGQFPCSVLPAGIEQGHLRALLVMGGNPMAAFPQPDRLAAELGRLPVLAAWDIVRSATAERATNSTLTWDTGSQPAPTPRLYLSPADAEAAGVHDGDRVQVTSPHGCLVATARLESAMSRGTVAVPHGFTEPNVGHLTATDVDLDPLTGMPTLVGVPVTLRVV
jgi:anaerobic selenocysteine-containing dehydrogenase